MTKALSIRNLSKTYKNGFEALKGIDLDVDAGDFFALLGPNGAGKTTTIGILSSLINKSDGKVKIFDVDIDEDFSRAKRFIGLVPQEFNFNVFEPVLEVVANQGGFYGIPRKESIERAENCINQLGLWDKRHQGARMLSGGMKRRLMIARALVHDPKLLILDEPTAGVDIEIRHTMWEFMTRINQEGTTIILTTHYLEEAENLCRNIAIIDEGKIVQHSSMRSLLHLLQRETFLLNLSNTLDIAPQINNYEVRLIDDTTLEVDVHRDQGINKLFSELSTKGIEVLSMRTKKNRLEQLFMGYVQRQDAGAGRSKN